MADDLLPLIHNAIDLSDAGDYEGAIKLLTQVINADPKIPQAYHERAMALINLECDRDAIIDFGKALELDPRFPGARNWRARTRAGLGDHRGAAQDMLQELRNHPDGPSDGLGVCPQSWADCAEQFSLASDVPRAVQLLEEYLAEYAAHVTKYSCYETAPLRLLARLLEQAGDIERAGQLRARARASPHRVPADE